MLPAIILIMNIILNGKPITIQESLSVTSFLKEMDISPIGIAIAINESICPKKQWNDYALKNADQVLIIQATQGG